ncbi:hypothetical protein EPN87_01880 [archaeon]|nr:MAG: hypothetical protein EPN87_01880 [archaeon]
MALRDLIPSFNFGKKEQPMELAEEPEMGQKVVVRVENLSGMVDVDRVLKLVRDGNILFLKTRDLQKKDIGEFQLSVQKLKRNCQNYGLDIVGTPEGYLLVTPKFVQILK